MRPNGDVDSSLSNPQPISSPDDNARDQFGGKLKTARHGRCPGSAVSVFGSGLISLGFAAVTKFGQPLIETSEPCGKRSFV